MSFIKVLSNNKILLIWGLFLVIFVEGSTDHQYHNHKNEFVITIPSYNNKDWYKKNLDSVFSQDYPHYEVIYIDDKSPDDTGKLVAQYIKDKGQEDRVTLIRNKKRLYHVANRHRMNYLVPDNKIIVELDGDDWFPHEHVLSYLDKAYSNSNAWLTYGQYKRYPSNKLGLLKPFPRYILRKNAFREYTWVASHLRTYYSWLFKQVKLEDFFYEGSFFKIGADFSYMFPILEMAGGNHIKFISDVLCIRNGANPIGTEKVWPREYIDTIHRYIRNKSRYTNVQEYTSNAHEPFIDMIVVAHNPYQLCTYLESVHRYMTGINNIYIVYTKNSNDAHVYADIEHNSSNLFLLECPDKEDIYYKDTILNFIKSLSSNYIVLATDAVAATDTIDLRRCAHILNNTFSYGFYLHLGFDKETLPENQYNDEFPYAYLEDDICAWQFLYSKNHWQHCNQLGMILYKKDTIMQRLQQLSFNNIKQLESTFSNLPVAKNKVGLFFEQLKTSKSSELAHINV